MIRLSLGCLVLLLAAPAPAQVLDQQKLLDAETFWDNRDWDWYKANIPFFECPDRDIQTTYYYRWELVTKHLTYGSPNTGYTFTEFIDRPFWSGAYGAISCPAGHQLYEVRWLRDPQYARDYSRYWFRTPGAQPRRYSTWLADAVWAVHRVHPDGAFIKNLLPDLVKNYQGWEKDHYALAGKLFWQTGHDDGMEININSRQTADTVRGARALRPTLNAYLWADALAIARAADLAGDKKLATDYRAKAAGLKTNLQKKLWDPKREFFFPMALLNESRDGFTVKAGSLTYQTGKFAGSPHGREEIGYVPWQFGLPDPGHEAAWKYLVDPEYFAAPFGPTTVERHDPLFALSKTCCWWSGQSWPYATTQTLKAMANLLHDYKQQVVSKADYLKLLQTYAKTHRKNGQPYIAEACHPDTGSWEGHDSYNHSEHYFHSGYCDLVITGLVGLRPRDDETVEVHPLAPNDWAYFALDNVPYRGHRISIIWDHDGTRYKFGKGLHVLADGKPIASADKLGRLTAKLSPNPTTPTSKAITVNYAVTNDGDYYPRVTASYSAPKTPLSKLTDGNYWYHRSPPNRWTCEGSPNTSDWAAIDFGKPRTIHTLKLYFLDDGQGITPPKQFELEYWNGKAWISVPGQEWTPKEPAGRRSNVVHFPPLEVGKIRTVFTHRGSNRTGLTEFEVLGDVIRPVTVALPPAGSLAFNPGDRTFPKASASYTWSGDKAAEAIDGRVQFHASPRNRWTAYDTPNPSDWLEIDFGEKKKIARLELAIYDDGGGVQAPKSYAVQVWDGTLWADAADQKRTPERPAGGQVNEVRFKAVTAAKVRVVFTHALPARSGVTEVFVWSK